ncbi:hypothetical protein HOLleu_24233 [Holothuria leucospilota]|uniref:BRCT domain-containing protein n=1 Tax=Holothuria leucospilota TaxID=206669 RepID=A0A9Q1BWF3_HOLLE|nr:hypothetical protein HOLleu_24233 [Holothuria leucospilota]
MSFCQGIQEKLPDFGYFREGLPDFHANAPVVDRNKTTHVICQEESFEDLNLQDNPQVKVVTPKWLWDSVAHRTVLDTDVYQI